MLLLNPGGGPNPGGKEAILGGILVFGCQMVCCGNKTRADGCLALRRMKVNAYSNK